MGLLKTPKPKHLKFATKDAAISRGTPKFKAITPLGLPGIEKKHNSRVIFIFAV